MNPNTYIIHTPNISNINRSLRDPIEYCDDKDMVATATQLSITWPNHEPASGSCKMASTCILYFYAF